MNSVPDALKLRACRADRIHEAALVQSALSQRRRSPDLGPVPEVLDLGRRSRHAPHDKGTRQVTEITSYLQVLRRISVQGTVRPVGISAIIGRRENKTAGTDIYHKTEKRLFFGVKK